MLLKLLFTPAAITGLQTTEKPLATLPKDIRPAQVIVSPDQSRFAWIFKNDDEIAVVVDGKKHKPCEWIVQDRLAFTADSHHVVYAARQRRKAMMVIDGKEGELIDGISNWLVSSGGAHVAFNMKSREGAQAVLDDVPQPAYDFVQLHALSADGVLA